MKITKALKKLKAFQPKIAVILGSGFNNLPFELQNAQTFSYAELGIKCAQLEGHPRTAQIGTYKGIPAIFASRIHYYETGNAADTLQIYNLFHELGVQRIVAVTSVGGINEELSAGDLMLIKSHINFTGANPLIGIQPVKFLDLGNAYAKDLRLLAKRTAKTLKIPLYEGIHIQDSGPTYETYAEVTAFKKMGADTVSMSTAFDAIAAAYFQIPFLAFAGVVNAAVTENSAPLTHTEVVRTATQISQNFFKILDGIWSKLL